MPAFLGYNSASADKNSIFPWSDHFVISVWCMWILWLWYSVWVQGPGQRSPLYVDCQWQKGLSFTWLISVDYWWLLLSYFIQCIRDSILMIGHCINVCLVVVIIIIIKYSSYSISSLTFAFLKVATNCEMSVDVKTV